MTGLVTLILTIALVGFLIYVLITYVPMPALFQRAIIVITVILIILYVIRTVLPQLS
jgi:hypothetical protein